MAMSHVAPRLRALISASVLAALSGQAGASGFAIIEQSASGLGNAFAGGAASAEDASTVFFNPAGLTRLNKTEVIVSAHNISPSLDFKDKGSVLLPGTPFFQPLSGADGAGASDPITDIIPVGNLYIAKPISNQLVAGLGINAPFGLRTEYGKDWQGRYQAVESDLQSVNINPSLAYKLNKQWSIGIGLNAMYASADLSNAVDFGTICTVTELGGGLPPGTCGASGLAPQQNDGFVKLEGDDWGWGFNAGVLWEPTERTRIGIAYRSKVEQTLDGDANFTVPAEAAFLTAGGSFVDTGAQASVDLPETLSTSIFHQVNDQWAIMGDVTWTRWERFEEFRVEYDSAQDDTVVEEAWENTLRLSMGATYALNDRWTLRGGVAFDESPIPDAQHRTPRIPGDNRTWVSIGAGYRLSDRIRFDVGYAHLFIDDAPIARVGDTGDVLVGEFEAAVDILSAQLIWTL